MTYFLTNSSYEWVIVSEETWKHPPSNMINNKACIDRDGLVHIDIANVPLYGVSGLVSLLKSVYEAGHGETKGDKPKIDEDKCVLGAY